MKKQCERRGRCGSWALVASLCTSVILAACGGGGSEISSSTGADAGANTTATLIGTAAKGLLANARVTAWAIGSDGPGANPLAETRTDDRGNYQLAIAATTGPVLVKVESIPGTLMLDETRIVNGEFVQGPAPVGLVLRSIVPAASTGTFVVGINPFTDAAVEAAATARDAAGRSVAWSMAAIAAGMQLARSLVNPATDPFTARASSLAKVADNTADQNELLVALTGFMNKANGCRNSGNSGNSGNASTGAAGTVSTGVLCEVEKLRALSRVSLDDQGGAGVKNADDLGAYVQQQYAAASLALTGTAVESLARTRERDARPVPATLALVALADAKQGLRNFAAALQVGLQQSKLSLAGVRQGSVDARLTTELAVGAMQAALRGLSVMGSVCNGAGQIASCPGWRVAEGGLSRTVSTPGVAGAQLDEAVFSDVPSASTANLQYMGEIRDAAFVQSSRVNQTAIVTLDAVGAPAAVDLDIDYQRFDSGVPGPTVSIRRLHLVPTGRVAAGLVTVSGSGSVSIDLRTGTTLTGTAQVSGTIRLGSTEVQGELLSFDFAGPASTAGRVNSPTHFVVTRSPGILNGLGHDLYTADGSVDVVPTTHFTASVTKASRGRVDAVAGIAVTGAEVVVRVAASQPGGIYCFPADAGVLCGNTLEISSRDGAYTSTLEGSATTADILYKGNVVGRISAAGVTIDGTLIPFATP